MLGVTESSSKALATATRRLALHSNNLSARSFTNSSPSQTAKMEKINTDKAAPPAGPYTQAIRAPPFIFVSGQIPATASGELVTGSVAEQTTASCEAVAAILRAAGSGIERVVKATVFLTDMADFAEMNGVYEKYFAHRPARSCVAVKQLPKGVPVEIEVVALA